MSHEEGKRLIEVCSAVLMEKDSHGKARNNKQSRKKQFEDSGNQRCLYRLSHVTRRQRSLDQKEVSAPVTEAQYESEAKDDPCDVEGRGLGPRHGQRTPD